MKGGPAATVGIWHEWRTTGSRIASVRLTALGAAPLFFFAFLRLPIPLLSFLHLSLYSPSFLPFPPSSVSPPSTTSSPRSSLPTESLPLLAGLARAAGVYCILLPSLTSFYICMSPLPHTSLASISRSCSAGDPRPTELARSPTAAPCETSSSYPRSAPTTAAAPRRHISAAASPRRLAAAAMGWERIERRPSTYRVRLRRRRRWRLLVSC
ncbi:hypothetical protein C8J57DRAFT_1674306 [Mycena rebaudengoi]|nr:hypothetical protein C8J57DRAFT_1674306 [Mycena rebaudengoi]